MNNICEVKKCSGCMACANVCKKDSISFSANNEGFLYPVIDPLSCNNCGLCKKICPSNCLPAKNTPLIIYSGWSKNEETRIKSSSGGVFTEIANIILEDDGVVFGCLLDDKLFAKHAYIDNKDYIYKLRGSKYVQSYIGNSYRQAKDFLDKGRKVLFSGTPCQIAALKNFLKKDYKNLYTIDIICHGVPSPMIFDDYKNYIENKNKIKIEEIQFRSKKFSWIYFNIDIRGVDKKNRYIGTYYKDPYLRGFLRDYYLRKSCHNCDYTTIDRIGDFTLADWWGYKKTTDKDKNYRKKGVSLIFLNTNKSLILSKKLQLELQERTIDEALKTNISLQNSFPESKERNDFWEFYKQNNFENVVSKYLYPEKMCFKRYLLNNIPNSDFNYFILTKIGGLLNKISKIKYFNIRSCIKL